MPKSGRILGSLAEQGLRGVSSSGNSRIEASVLAVKCYIDGFKIGMHKARSANEMNCSYVVIENVKPTKKFEMANSLSIAPSSPRASKANTPSERGIIS